MVGLSGLALSPCTLHTLDNKIHDIDKNNAERTVSGGKFTMQKRIGKSAC